MKKNCVYIVGVCGSAMSAIARWFKKNCFEVFGCDDCKSDIFSKLLNEGINVCLDSYQCAIPEKILQNKDEVLVTYSPAVHENHPKLKFFRDNGFKILSRKEIVQNITKEFYTISVAGTHGKTTTSALLSHMLYEGHCNLAGFIGGITKNYDSNMITYGNFQNPNVVMEADEYDRFFLCLKSNISIVTTMDGDHYDIYKNFENYKQGFFDFINNTKPHGVTILHKDVYNQLIEQNKAYNFYVNFYNINDAPIHAENVYLTENNCYHFDYISPKKKITDLVLRIPGIHNVNNALAAITAALYLKVNEYVIRESLKTFLGVKKRFDIVYHDEKFTVIDDYAHHPTEITAVVNTVRSIYPGKKITAIFRPNQFSRTQDFLQQFAQSLDLADQVIVLDIFSDREDHKQAKVSNKTIVDNMKNSKKVACSLDQLIEALDRFDSHDIIINFGAGDSETFIDSIIAYLKNRYF